MNFGIKLPKIRQIRLRITIYFSLLIFLIILAISFSISFIFSQQVIEQTSSVVQQKMTIITRDIDEKLNSIKSISTDLRKDESLQELMAMETLTNEEYKNKAVLISGMLSSKYSNGNNSISNIIAISNENQVFDPLYSVHPYRDAITQSESYKKFLSGNYFNKFSEPFTFPTDQKANMSISYYCQYLDNKNFQKLGYMLINVKKESLFEDVKAFCADVFDTTYIINKDGKIIYDIGDMEYVESVVNKDLPATGSRVDTAKLDGKNYLVFSEVLKNYTDWRVIGIISKDKLTQKVWFMNMVTYMIGFVCLMLVVGIGFYLSKRITGPILEVNKAMGKFEKGEWPDKIEINTEDELKNLVKGFNKMVGNIRSLIEEIYKEQEEKKKAEVTALQFQLESLQYQINPHFMYNTLNAISYLALKRGADDIREMIQSFNVLLRASMSVGKEFIPVEEEITCVRNYLKIQECRYDSIFDFVCLVPDDMKECKIPRLILQPLVENSLFHGIAPKNSHGTIKVEFIREHDKIKVKVIDDGVGIRKDIVPQVVVKEKKRNKSAFNNIGLANVDERLGLYFGDEHRLKIFSDAGIGTCVEFYIPWIE